MKETANGGKYIHRLINKLFKIQILGCSSTVGVEI